jgi:PAS domain S-box-containing protein
MSLLLKKIFAPRKFEYLLINQDFIILEMSFGIHRFADQPSEVALGKDVREGFPELIGSEEVIHSILAGEKASFSLKGIDRVIDENNPLYLDLYISQYEDEHLDENSNVVENSRAILVFEEVTEIMVLKQELVQRVNETSLLMSALSRSKSYLDKIIHSMADALIITDLEGIIKNVNQATLDLFGYLEQELIGKPISCLMAEPDFLIKINKNIKNPEPYDLFNGIEVICKTKNKELVFIEFSCSMVQTDILEPKDLVYVGRNITERKKIELENRQSIEKARELNNLKSQFISMTSHEFRTPLTIILTSLELLRTLYTDSEQNHPKFKTYFQMIQSSVHHMRNLLDDILILGQAEAGKLEFNPELFDLAQYCRDLIKEIGLLDFPTKSSKINKSHPLNFVCSLSSLEVWMDKKLLRQILSNLLSNAIKYSPSEIPVLFEISRQNDRVIFKIQDQGMGIPPEDQKRLFELFYRAKNARHISGTGLGLAIVQRSVELHGGQILVSSQVGVGTTFQVMIPINWNRQRQEEKITS